jgi:hypothetical protein
MPNKTVRLLIRNAPCKIYKIRNRPYFLLLYGSKLFVQKNSTIKFTNMSESENRKVHPSWLGFHRDGLIAVLILDCLWMFIEGGAVISIVGIPAIPLIVFAIFGLSSYIVFSKQRILGDRPTPAMVKAVLLGVIAAVPFPVFYTILFVGFGVLHKLLPQAHRAAEKLPVFEHENLGKFASDFKEIEELLKQAVQKVDSSQISSKVSQNIDFLIQKGMMPQDLTESLDEIRKIRNRLIHEDLDIPKSIHLELLKKCKEDVAAVFKQ